MTESKTPGTVPATHSKASPLSPPPARGTAFDRPRDWLGNRFVYAVISSRAGGLSLGVNMNPDRRCNFDCCYCEVDRRSPSPESMLPVEIMAAELHRTIRAVCRGDLRAHAAYQFLPDELLRLRHVALSGDGEPTLAPNFLEAVQAVTRVRALGDFFKIVLLTNGTGLDQPHVARGLEHLTRSDEIWIKLDGGTQEFVNAVNRPGLPLEKILENILLIGRQRPVVIQSLFPSIRGAEPAPAEIQAYALRLKELREAGAQISLVQIHSAARPAIHPECGHVPLRTLSQIAHTVRDTSGLRAEIF